MALLLLWKRPPTDLLGKVSKSRSCSVIASPQLPGNQLKINWKGSPRSSFSVYSGIRGGGWFTYQLFCTAADQVGIQRISYQDFIRPEPVLMSARLLPVCCFTGSDLTSTAEMLVRQEKVEGGPQKQNENSTRKFPFLQILRICHQHLFPTSTVCHLLEQRSQTKLFCHWDSYL